MNADVALDDDLAAPRHVSFLAYRGGRHLKLAIGLGVAALVAYAAVRPLVGRNGASWPGYTLGVVGAGLILWLTWYGYRKRSYARRTIARPASQAATADALAARLSAHVYFGLVLWLIVTLHTGFRFGWNVHTLAYALMCLVIGSGIFGVAAYRLLPRAMTANRNNMTRPQMLARVAALNNELQRAALPLDDAGATMVRRAVETTAIGGSAWRQLTGRYPDCATAAAIAALAGASGSASLEATAAHRAVRVLLDEKAALLARLRYDIRCKAIMDIWLYVHIPATFALLAALAAHVLAEFFLW